MQYGNPYFAQPFQQIQPYQDRLAQLQNSYQQAMPYGQTQIQQPMPQVPQIPIWHVRMFVNSAITLCCLPQLHSQVEILWLLFQKEATIMEKNTALF